MRIPILTFGAFASVLTINSVMADTTVTSKQYVDTTRQATIPAAGTNEDEPGETVVTYTDTAGVIGERGIYNLATKYQYQAEEYDESTDANKLVTASTLRYLPEARVASRHCYNWIDNAPRTDENCLLWELTEVPVRAWQCETDNDCRGYSRYCAGGGECFKGECACFE